MASALPLAAIVAVLLQETFMAVLGHDLRSPLAAMSNCMLLLGKPEMPMPSRDRVLQIAARSIAHMDGLIADSLEYTRTRLGPGIEVIAKPGDFGALCLETFEQARIAHSDHRLVFESSGELTGCFDSARMDQVLTNLFEQRGSTRRS